MVTALAGAEGLEGCSPDHAVLQNASMCVRAFIQTMPEQVCALDIRVRFHIIRNARIENVDKSQSCMVSKLRIIWKQTVQGGGEEGGVGGVTGLHRAVAVISWLLSEGVDDSAAMDVRPPTHSPISD